MHFHILDDLLHSLDKKGLVAEERCGHRTLRDCLTVVKDTV